MLWPRHCGAVDPGAGDRLPPAAAGEMDLAYSKAWRMVKNSEAALGYKLLISQTGGKNGGGASLSPEAKDMLRRYEEFVAAGEQGLDALFGKIFQGMVAP